MQLRLNEQIESKGRTLTVTALDIKVLADARTYLVEVARNGSTVTYGEMISALTLPYPPHGLGRTLDLLSEDCIRLREPSLAALVVNQVSQEVGPAFDGDPIKERKALYAHWAQRPR